MSLGQPVGELGRACPKCGAVQDSPGSTFCEACGTDLRVGPLNTYPSQPQSRPQPQPLRSVPRSLQLSQLRHLLGMPVRLLKRGIGALLSLISSIFTFIWRLVSFTLKIAVALLVIGSIIVGLSYVPEVRARVPVIKQAPKIGKQLLSRGEAIGSKWLAGLTRSGADRQSQRPATPRRTPQQARPTQQPPKTPRQPATSKPAAIAQKPAPARAPALLPFSVKSTPSGAVVQIDTRQVGKTPLTLKVAPGTHKVTISRPGYESVTRTVTVKAGKPASVNVKLVARRTPKRTAPVQKPPAENPRDP